jgi:hypothetical protein
VPFVRGRKYSYVGAFTIEGIVCGRVVEGAFDFNQFWDWFFEELVPVLNVYPGRRSVVVLDNARIHHNPEMLELAEMCGIVVKFLPSYSPDLNPIELYFNYMKQFLKRAGVDLLNVNENILDVPMLLHGIAQNYTAEMSLGSFRHSGYDW